MGQNSLQVNYIDQEGVSTEISFQPKNSVTPIAERRNSLRKPVIKGGKVIIEDGGSEASFECLIIDQSMTGALVDLGTPVAVPEKMTLQINDGASYFTRRVWVSGTKIGLQVLGELPSKNRPEREYDTFAYINDKGEVAAKFGDWLGEPGSQKWIEGFLIRGPLGVDLSDLTYQVMLRPDCFSPNFESGRFCGARGMETPILGLRIQLLGKAKKSYELSYQVSFVDGTFLGPLGSNVIGKSETYAPLEAIKVMLKARISQEES